MLHVKSCKTYIKDYIYMCVCFDVYIIKKYILIKFIMTFHLMLCHLMYNIYCRMKNTRARVLNS